MKELTIVRRIGLHPHYEGTGSTGKRGCPDIFELSNGQFAIVGIDKTAYLKDRLPSDASCGDDERIVIVDRHVLINAKRDIPES
jgi:hypothetical protein